MSFDKKKKNLDSTKSSTSSKVFTLHKKDNLQEWIEYHSTHIAGKFAPISIAEVTTGVELSSTQYIQSKMLENPMLPLLPVPANQLSQEQLEEIAEIRAQANMDEVTLEQVQEFIAAADILENIYTNAVIRAYTFATTTNATNQVLNNIIGKGYEGNMREYLSINPKRIESVDYLLSDACVDSTIRGLIIGDPKFVSVVSASVKGVPFTKVHAIFEIMREKFGDQCDDEDIEGDIGVLVGDSLQKLLRITMKTFTGFNQYFIEWTKVRDMYVCPVIRHHDGIRAT